MKIRNILLFGAILSLSFSGCSQKNLNIISLEKNEDKSYAGTYDFNTKQLTIYDGINKLNTSKESVNFLQSIKYPTGQMQIGNKMYLDCGVIVTKSKLFTTNAIVQKGNVRTFGLVNLDSSNRLYITIDEEYMIGEARDQDGKCYKIYLNKIE